jgi:nicotinate-nucleotide--dimethylbenzimidazole phosphoribosyltransferase
MTFQKILPIAQSDLALALKKRIDSKTKPANSLGFLEALALQIGLIQQTTAPQLVNPSIFVFAGDHGITAENVSAFPQEVTWQMVENFLSGGAAINVFAQQNGLQLRIVDAGVKHDFGVRVNLLDRKIAHGTSNFSLEKAMSAAQCQSAIEQGLSLIEHVPGNVVGFGEMGIGNTTSAAAIMHQLTGLPLTQCCGAGTGLDYA